MLGGCHVYLRYAFAAMVGQDDDRDLFGPGLEQGSDEETPVCRICFDHKPSSPFVSPCACKGSQQFVHIACLRRWQQCVLGGKLALSKQAMSDKASR